MKALILALAASALAAGAPALAQPDRGDYHDRGRDHDRGYDHDRGDHGDRGEHRGWGRDYGEARHDWRRGERMGYNDWRRGRVIDYRAHHLRRPPRGYEWREVNGNYVLAAVATGLIASIIANSGQ